jgi:hypothetical protein
LCCVVLCCVVVCCVVLCCVVSLCSFHVLLADHALSGVATLFRHGEGGCHSRQRGQLVSLSSLFCLFLFVCIFSSLSRHCRAGSKTSRSVTLIFFLFGVQRLLTLQHLPRLMCVRSVRASVKSSIANSSAVLVPSTSSSR